MKKQTLLIGFVLALASVLVFSTGALAPNPAAAAKGGNPGPPDGKGGGGGAPDYGDLIILYRDADGVPIPSEAVEVPDPETGELVAGGLCWQPIAFNVDDTTACPATCVVNTTDPATVEVDQFTCGVATGCSGCTQEVDFGRINEARSPDDVFEAQLEDVVTKLATADCRILDPAGRMAASTVAGDVVTTSTIDSPLQNLAIYRQLMLTGTIGAPLPDGAGLLDTAARGLGVASDKSGGVNVDMVAYLNQIMGLSDPLTPTVLDPKICMNYREEVQGTIQSVEKCFLDYSSYSYERSANFPGLPDPAYIPAGAPVEGWFEYLAPNPDNPGNFIIAQGPITTAVFADAPGFLGGNIGGFAQAADDTRAVIKFMHDNPIPAGEETPMDLCEAADGTHYDLSISEVSGLQVPVRLVAGTEGREFTVTVANAGPDLAVGAVMVQAVDQSGSSTILEFAEDFSLAAGTSASWTGSISIPKQTDITGIDWTAAAVPDASCVNTDGSACEVNPVNNTVTAFTRVIAGKGGGGGGH